MEITPIRNDADLMAALAEVDQLAEGDPSLGTPAGDKLEILATLIQSYEAEHHPMGSQRKLPKNQILSYQVEVWPNGMYRQSL